MTYCDIFCPDLMDNKSSSLTIVQSFTEHRHLKEEMDGKMLLQYRTVGLM